MKLYVLFLYTPDYVMSSRVLVRSFIQSCGLLFCEEEVGLGSGRTKEVYQFFWSDSMEGRFLHDPNFVFYDDFFIIEGCRISTPRLRAVMVSEDDEDVSMCLRICSACVQAGKKYNSIDRVLRGVVPFYSPSDACDVYSAECMHSAQAVVLILRACLGSSHPVGKLLQGFNSRAASPYSLASLLCSAPAPHTLDYFIPRTVSGAVPA